MNRGLTYLLRKRPVGWIRAVRRRVHGGKGVLLVLVALAFLALLIGPQVFVAQQSTSEEVAAMAARLRLWGPAALMFMAVLSMSSGVGLHFRQSEIDFLFPAPIGRRELLLYHVLGRLIVVLLSALWMAIFVLRWAPQWYAGILGLFTGLAFLQLTSQLVSLILSTYSVRVTKRLRRCVLVGVLVLVATGLLVVRQQLPAQATLGAAARGLAESTVVVVATAPARVFVEVFASETAGQFALWASVGLAVLIVLFALIVTLDVAYTEGAVRATRQVQERLRRMRAGGGAMAAPAPGAVRFSLPAAPWLGGAGPIAWRQGIEALRNIRGIAFTSLFTIAFPTVFVFFSVSGEGWETGKAAQMALLMIVLMTVIMNQNLALDFRRDLDRMVYLKSLPLPARSVALGQILPGILVFTLLQAIAITVLVVALGISMPWPWPMFLLLVPFNWLAMALDNVLFLWFPYRFAPKEAGNFQFMGRTMMVMFAKMLLLMLAVGVAALVLWQLGKVSLLLAGIAVGGVLVLEAWLLTCLLGRVFRAFDVTVDIPG